MFEAIAADTLCRVDQNLGLVWDDGISRPGSTCEQRAKNLRTAQLLAERCNWKSEAVRFGQLLEPYRSDLPITSPINIDSVWSSFSSWAKSCPDPFSFDGI